MDQLPSDALTKPTPRAPWIVTGVAVLAIAAGGIFGGPALAGALNPAPKPTSTLTQVAQTGSVNAAPYASPEDVNTAMAGVVEIQTEQAAEAAAAAQAAQAAADAAAAAAAKSTHRSSSTGGPVKCPAGSQANSGDGENDTSCFPEICFHISLPDPAHPECVTAFKP